MFIGCLKIIWHDILHSGHDEKYIIALQVCSDDNKINGFGVYCNIEKNKRLCKQD